MEQLTPSEARRIRERMEVLRLIADFVAKGTKPTAAVSQVAQILGISERTIFSILKSAKNEQSKP